MIYEKKNLYLIENGGEGARLMTAISEDINIIYNK